MTCMEYMVLYMVTNNLYVHINKFLSLILHGYRSIIHVDGLQDVVSSWRGSHKRNPPKKKSQLIPFQTF